ncbi:MAG: CPBP family intramembrane glutamic endopeptidase [Polyangiales bacterium]
MTESRTLPAPAAIGLMAKLGELHPKRFFLETWQRMDREAAAERQARPGYDWRPLVALCLGAVCLTLMEYFGGSIIWHRLVTELSASELAQGPSGLWNAIHLSSFMELSGFAWWSACRVVGYCLIPILSLWLLGERARDHGLATRGFLQHAWIYLLCYLIVLGCVITVSFMDSFASYYPFYKQASRSWADFIAWELLYAAQFFSLEFFFRGYWLNACKRMMGSHAIFAMVVPYCMIHFGKPWLEALAAIIAGVVLGTLAMKTRSIWSGVLIHVSVAISMDVAALLQTTGLPRQWLYLPPV